MIRIFVFVCILGDVETISTTTTFPVTPINITTKYAAILKTISTEENVSAGVGDS